MGVLARILEESGIATVGLSLVRRQAGNIKAPRFLHCEFPLGRPLGKPGDPDYQTDVIRRAFSLLDRTDVQVIEDHPGVIDDDAEHAAICTLPPRHNPDVHPAVDEAQALRPAYMRQVEAADGRTAVGRLTGPDAIGDLVDKFVTLADTGSVEAAGFNADTVRAAGQDVRAYYEEAGLALSDLVPAARQLESWFYQQTQTGAIMRGAAGALEASGEPRLYLRRVPAHGALADADRLGEHPIAHEPADRAGGQTAALIHLTAGQQRISAVTNISIHARHYAVPHRSQPVASELGPVGTLMAPTADGWPCNQTAVNLGRPAQAAKTPLTQMHRQPPAPARRGQSGGSNIILPIRRSY